MVSPIPNYPAPPRGFQILETIEQAYTDVLITLPLASVLIPLFLLILFLSDASSRRTYLFGLNVSIVLLGIVQGVLSTAVYSTIILQQQTPIPDAFFLIFIGVALYIPIIVDCILILRLSVVYPGILTRPSIRFAILFPPALCTAARIVCVTIVIHRWSLLSVHEATAIMVTKIVWPSNPYLISDWVIQLFENAYCSVLFIYKLRARKAFSSRMYREQSFASRLRAVFYIAVCNWVFPTVLSILQLFYILHDPSLRHGATLILVNNSVSIIGVVFCTIWCATDVWQGKHFQQAVLTFSALFPHITTPHTQSTNIRQSAISLSGIAPNLDSFSDANPTSPTSNPNPNGTREPLQHLQTRRPPTRVWSLSLPLSLNRLGLGSLSMFSGSVRSAFTDSGPRSGSAIVEGERRAASAEGSNGGKEKEWRGSKLSKTKNWKKMQQQPQVTVRRTSGHEKGASWDSRLSSLEDYKGFGIAYDGGAASLEMMPRSTRFGADETMAGRKMYTHPQMEQTVDSHMTTLVGHSNMGKVMKTDYGYRYVDEEDKGVGTSRSRSGSGAGTDEKTLGEVLQDVVLPIPPPSSLPYPSPRSVIHADLHLPSFSSSLSPSYSPSAMATSHTSPRNTTLPCPSSYLNHPSIHPQPSLITAIPSAASTRSLLSTTSASTNFNFASLTPPPVSYLNNPANHSSDSNSPTDFPLSTSSLGFGFDARGFS